MSGTAGRLVTGAEIKTEDAQDKIRLPPLVLTE